MFGAAGLCVPLMQRHMAGGVSAGQQEAQLTPLQESYGRKEQIAFIVSLHNNLFRRERAMYRHSRKHRGGGPFHVSDSDSEILRSPMDEC